MPSGPSGPSAPDVSAAPDAPSARSEPANTVPGPALAPRASVESPPPGEARFAVRGMTCAACSAAVERVLGRVDGVEAVQVSLATGEARIRWDPARQTPEALAAVVSKAGYELTLPAPREAEAPEAPPPGAGGEDAFRRFRWGAALSVPVVLLGHHDWVPGLHGLPHEALRGLWALSGLLTLPILIWVGGGFFTRGWKAARRGAPNMDTLVALGTGSAFVYSVFAVALPQLFPDGTAHPFFEAAAVIVTLVVLGQALEGRARQQTTSALRGLLELTPPMALRLEGGNPVEVPVGLLRVDDRVLVRPGTRVPVDGVVEEGESAIDESMWTGESIPVDRGPGDRVIGGTLNRSGSFRMRVTGVGADTVLAQIVERVREAQGSKPPIQRLADRVSGVFVPLVVLLALVSFAVWMVVGPEPRLNYAVVVAVSILVIACPCALGLATPISVMIAVGNAARHGILVRNGSALEGARRVDTLLLDKTGTVTRGTPRLTDFHGVRPDGEWITDTAERDALLALVAGAEFGSEHPLAEAVVAEARARGLELPSLTGFEALGGRGIRARIGESELLVGTPRFMDGSGVHLPPALDAALTSVLEAGKTPAVAAVDGRARAVLGWADLEKDDAAAAIRRFKALGLEVRMVTGDHEGAARAVAARVGIDRVHAGVLPEGKADLVAQLRAEGRRVAMVGDGVNDAPALAAADVGFAVGTGTDIARDAADVTLLGGSLHGVADAVELSRAAVRNMKQNLFGAFAYNTASLPVAAGVLYPAFGLLLSPMIAGAAMAFSSVTVVTNANRLRGWRPRTR
jgi:P-type Cu+ transporter